MEKNNMQLVNCRGRQIALPSDITCKEAKIILAKKTEIENPDKLDLKVFKNPNDEGQQLEDSQKVFQYGMRIRMIDIYISLRGGNIRS